MAKPNISLLGATYSGVAGVTLPKQGGGTATFPWVEGSETKTQNGIYDVTNLAQLIVNVAGGGGSGLEYESGTFTPDTSVSRPTISFSNTHATTPFLTAISDTSSPSGISSTSITSYIFFDMYRLTGSGYPYSTALAYSAEVFYTYRTSSASSVGSIQVRYDSDDPTDTSTQYSRYFATESAFYPYSNSNSRYFRANRVYKWIAVWKPTS